jgi:tetratricopeptide (TPR) repeat protein
VRTPHFEILSSLDAEETLDLVRDAELFHTTAEFALGLTFPPPVVPTRIFAFDGRGFVRPFDVRGEPGYFLPSLRGATIVLRTGDGWRLDATVKLRHAYVHYLLRNHGGFERPLWFDEGSAEFLSTAAVSEGRIDLGRFRSEQVKLLRDQPWIPLIRILRSEDLEDWGPRRRAVFYAESWAFVHYLNFGRGRPGQGQAQLGRYFKSLEESVPHEQAVERAFGVGSSDLDRELQDFVRSDRFASVAFRLQPAESSDASESRPLTRAEVLSHLGWLSISLARADQAQRYFERAVADDPQNARAHAGLGEADALRGRWETAAPHLGRALGIAPDDPLNQIDAASYYYRRAAATEDDEARASFAALARRHCGESWTLADPLPEAYADYGSTFLLANQTTERAVEPLEQANRMLGSSEEIKLRLGQLYLQLGRPGSARRQAASVFSRTHSPAMRNAARDLLDRIDESIAGRSRRRESRKSQREILIGPDNDVYPGGEAGGTARSEPETP